MTISCPLPALLFMLETTVPGSPAKPPSRSRGRLPGQGTESASWLRSTQGAGVIGRADIIAALSARLSAPAGRLAICTLGQVSGIDESGQR